MPPHGCDSPEPTDSGHNYRAISANDVAQLRAQVEPSFAAIGLEVHTFKVAWYNALVAPEYSLKAYHDDTLALLVISRPSMFELAFLPFLAQTVESMSTTSDASNVVYGDPIDKCMQHYFGALKQVRSDPFSTTIHLILISLQELTLATDSQIDVMHDFELEMPSRRPKILLQTAAHVSGAAYYYKVTSGKQRMGVCIHPAYGGWFGIRGVFLLRDLLVPDLPLTHPPDVVSGEEQQAELLRLFNDHWRDMSYRDCIPHIKATYSPLQRQYFALKPKERIDFIKRSLLPLLKEDKDYRNTPVTVSGEDAQGAVEYTHQNTSL